MQRTDHRIGSGIRLVNERDQKCMDLVHVGAENERYFLTLYFSRTLVSKLSDHEKKFPQRLEVGDYIEFDKDLEINDLKIMVKSRDLIYPSYIRLVHQLTPFWSMIYGIYNRGFFAPKNIQKYLRTIGNFARREPPPSKTI